MNQVLHDDFLLTTETASKLYHTFSEPMPVIDYHCHIDPMEIARDRCYDNITQVWLGGDHYKWRLMRANGVPEEYVTGNAPDREKFQKFAEVMHKAPGSPVYQWVHLELKNYFGYEGELNGDTVGEVWTLCNERLKTLRVRGMIERYRVETVITTDDPVDSLAAHKEIAADPTCRVRVLPAWRPDKVMNIHKQGFPAYVEKLSWASGVEIRDLESLFCALRRRMDYFDLCGCRVSDHGLERTPIPASPEEAENIFARALIGTHVSQEEASKFQYVTLCFLAGEYCRRGWVMQLHLCAAYGINAFRQAAIGPDTGFDGIGTSVHIPHLAAFLNETAGAGKLGKTILYSLNPNDTELLAVLTGAFQEAGFAGKLQLGAAWWFNDTESGIRKQLAAVANNSLLGNFVGMLTDSRSFLSYARHEYFRRILCDMVGSWMECGRISADLETWGNLVADVSYGNAKRYFLDGLV